MTVDLAQIEATNQPRRAADSHGAAEGRPEFGFDALLGALRAGLGADVSVMSADSFAQGGRFAAFAGGDWTERLESQTAAWREADRIHGDLAVRDSSQRSQLADAVEDSERFFKTQERSPDGKSLRRDPPSSLAPKPDQQQPPVPKPSAERLPTTDVNQTPRGRPPSSLVRSGGADIQSVSNGVSAAKTSPVAVSVTAAGSINAAPAAQPAMSGTAASSGKFVGQTTAPRAIQPSPVAGDARGESSAVRTSAKGRNAQPAPGASAAERQEAIDRLVKLIRAGAGRRDMRLTMQLNPPELGKVKIDLHMRRQEATLRLVTETPHARRLLAESSDTLREAMSRHGIEIVRLDVELNEAVWHRRRTPPDDDHRQRRRRQAPEDGVDRSPDVPTTSGAKIIQVPGLESGLDIRV